MAREGQKRWVLKRYLKHNSFGAQKGDAEDLIHRFYVKFKHVAWSGWTDTMFKESCGLVNVVEDSGFSLKIRMVLEKNRICCIVIVELLVHYCYYILQWNGFFCPFAHILQMNSRGLVVNTRAHQRNGKGGRNLFVQY